MTQEDSIHQQDVGENDTNELGATSGSWCSLIRLVNACQRKLGRLLTGLGDLSDSELLVLWICWEHRREGAAQVQLAESAGLSTAQVSHLVERLGGSGLLQSQPAPGDRRRRLWRLTDAGRQRLQRCVHQLADELRELSGRIQAGELASLIELLSQVEQWTLSPRSTDTAHGTKEKAA